MQLAFLLGRIPSLAQKEIEAAATILPFRWSATMVQPNILLLKESGDQASPEAGKSGFPSDDFLKVVDRLQRRLGGTSSIVRVIDQVKQAEILDRLEKLVTDSAPSAKLDMGVSLYGSAKVGSLGIGLKQRLKAAGLSVRYVAPKEGQKLSSAQVYHNRLAVVGPDGRPQQRGRELVVIQDGQQFLIGHTLTVQDIDSYSKRDFGIPVPDSVSGMLPPKLAQTLVNLAVGSATPEEIFVYDPFCGNGRIVLEARLMGYQAFGSDLEQGKVAASIKNLTWLAGQYRLPLEQEPEWIFWAQDARESQGAAAAGNLSQASGRRFCLASEPYLGRPLRRPLRKDQQGDWLVELTNLYEKFFAIWASAAARPERMVLVFPSAKLEGGGELDLYSHLVDRLGELGYSSSVLGRYSRPDTLISRDIVTIDYR